MRRRLRRALRGLAVVAFVVVPPVQGQAAPPPEPGSELSVYLMTMGVGQAVWERFGHNAIGIRDARTGEDVVYNYGIFSFEEPGFLLRFVRGRMTYWVAAWDAAATVAAYRRANRSVWIQELTLTPAERVALRDFLAWNAREENKFYRYDYYRDNCSTRVRDALDRALGGALRRRTGSDTVPATFRSHTLRLTSNNPAIWTGLLVAEGQPVDRPITAWDEMFLPLALREHVRSVTVTASDGRVVPLVGAERTLFESDRPVRAAAPAWWPGFLLAGVLLGGGLALLPRRRGKRARALFLVLGSAWAWLAGLAGLVLLGLWFLTDHAITARNENVLQLSPLLLLVGLLLPWRLTGRRRALLRGLAAAVAGLSLLGLLLKLAPGFGQENLTALALTLPLNVGLACGVFRLAPAPDPAP